MKNEYRLKHLEFSLAHGCNLMCESCDHQTSFFSATGDFPSLRKFKDAVDVLSKYIKVERFQFLGGEPLLNQEILEFIQHLRKSKMANYISLITNGTLLERLTEEICEQLDEVIISQYPGVKQDTNQLTRVERICNKTNTSLVVRQTKRFQRAIIDVPLKSFVASFVYRKCSIKYHTLFEGHLSRCSRMPFILLSKNISSIQKDLLEITDQEDFISNLDIFLNSYSSTPDACYYCLGALGKWHDHKIKKNDASKRTWMDLSLYRVAKRLIFGKN